MKNHCRNNSPHPTTVCAWCNGVIRLGAAKISHGICSPCRTKWFGKLTRGAAAMAAIPLQKSA
jgi:hypothetical protein